MKYVLKRVEGIFHQRRIKIDAPIGTIPMDSIFTPIKNVKYSIEDYIEQKTDYGKLIFQIFTDGSILPKDALNEAAKILIHHFMLFSDERISIETDGFKGRWVWWRIITYEAVT